MAWADLFFYGLVATVLVAPGVWTARVAYVRRRCRECGRGWALRRVPGTRRDGFVRFRCKYCGTKQWGVIEPKSENGPTFGPP
ncbi:MAG: hypothetical protein ACYTDU_01370 [Planctomycetota bacterium]|jgi:hypothetical protein